ncbi:unnamed protein product [Camellia sinensis]
MNMKMKMKTSVKMGRRGFMCQSPAATAVCMTGDPRSVILPRRPDHAPTLLNNINNYTRLVESRRFGSADKRSSNALVPSVKTDRAIDRDRKALHKPPSVTSSSDQVFQVVVMRVSLHCQGCAGKVKKHISKMEGGDIIQHRFGEQEGDSDGTRVTSRSLGEHIKGEKSRVLALLMGFGFTVLW